VRVGGETTSSSVGRGECIILSKRLSQSGGEKKKLVGFGGAYKNLKKRKKGGGESLLGGNNLISIQRGGEKLNTAVDRPASEWTPIGRMEMGLNGYWRRGWREEKKNCTWGKKKRFATARGERNEKYQYFGIWGSGAEKRVIQLKNFAFMGKKKKKRESASSRGTGGLGGKGKGRKGPEGVKAGP